MEPLRDLHLHDREDPWEDPWEQEGELWPAPDERSVTLPLLRLRDHQLQLFEVPESLRGMYYLG